MSFQRSFWPFLGRSHALMDQLGPTCSFGFFVSLSLRQYYVQWYGRVDPSPFNTLSGTYAGDEPGVSATLILRPDHTFEQTIHTVSSRIRRKEVGVSGRTVTSSSRKIFSRLLGRRSAAMKLRLLGTLKAPISRFRLQRPPDRECRFFARSSSSEKRQNALSTITVVERSR